MRWGARTPDRGALDRDRGAIRNTGPKENPSGFPAVRSELRPWVMDGLGKGAGRPQGRPTGSEKRVTGEPLRRNEWIRGQSMTDDEC